MSFAQLRYGLAICLAALPLLSNSARADDSKEYLVKAAFIYNFLKYVEWPGEKHSSIDICVYADGPMMATSGVFKQASTAQLGLSLVEENSAKNIASHCHIVFIGHEGEGALPEVLSALKGAPVLTVSDAEGFAEHGGMIEFTTQENKIKLIVNPKAAKAAGLRINAQLLEIALKVIDR